MTATTGAGGSRRAAFAGPLVPGDIGADAGSQVNILIVDDEPRNLSVLESILDDPDYRLVRALSGDEALLALMADDFAVLVLDVRMPGMTGFELAQMIKERKRTARIPIIFLTAYCNEDQHILEGYGSGAVDYLHKPVNASILRSKVAVFAELHRTGRALAIANSKLTDEVSERRKAEHDLGELNEHLDRRVNERTAELRESEERLMEANRRKDEFLATLAHELRNPLAPVRNALQFLKMKGGFSTELQWAGDLIDRQISAMARLIDDLMDVSRINQGRIELKRESTPLSGVLEDALLTVRPLVDELGHSISMTAPAGEIVLDADRTRLAQAFTNMLNNAAKYMDGGGRISVTVERNGNGDGVLVRVRDQGIGIPVHRLERVFDMFAQEETALSRSRGGLGIGLSLSRRLIEMHGGTVTAASNGPGQGSEFLVHLPCSPYLDGAPLPAAAAGPDFASGARMRVLVADDNLDAAQTLAMLLEMMGHEVRQVGDGEAAIAAAAEFEPRLALLDIGMPKVNGYEACRRIRAQANGRPLTLVAVTGWGQPEDRENARAAGFDLHMVKPIDMDVLAKLLSDPGGSWNGGQ